MLCAPHWVHWCWRLVFELEPPQSGRALGDQHTTAQPCLGEHCTVSACAWSMIGVLGAPEARFRAVVFGSDPTAYVRTGEVAGKEPQRGQPLVIAS